MKKQKSEFKLWTIQRTDTNEFTDRDRVMSGWGQTPRMFTRKSHLTNHVKQCISGKTYRLVPVEKLLVVEYTLPVLSENGCHWVMAMKTIPFKELFNG